MAKVLSFSARRRKAARQPPKSAPIKVLTEEDHAELGEIWISDTKGSRKVCDGTRGQAADMNRNLAYGLESGAWFTFRAPSRASESYG